MRKRLALAAVAGLALTLPVTVAGTARADAGFHVSGAYQTDAQCEAAGQAGYNLWGPNFFCQPSGGWVYLMTH